MAEDLDELRPPVDHPITTSKEDSLQRAPLAHDFAKSLRSLSTDQGVVVGVLGPWGVGKSSFINLMREEFAADPALTVVDFNPWLFSGTQQLTDFFFAELSSQLRLKDGSRFGAIADRIDEYSTVLSPLALIPGFGSWWDRSVKALQSANSIRKKRASATSKRTKVADALEQVDQPIVVVVDDIDRLTTPEIRDIFKLVRLTASFPNLIYVLAFDRHRVEAALDEDGVPGRAYLEKIIQLAFDLPAVPDTLLRSKVFAELDRILEGLEDSLFDSTRWADIYFELVEPLMSNMRDVSRLALSAKSTINALHQDVELVDVIALEAIRIFRPEIFADLQSVRALLTNIGSFTDLLLRQHKARMEEVLEKSGNADFVKNVIRRLFPAAQRLFENYSYGPGSLSQWRRQHRVAHADFFSLYLDRVAPAELASFRSAEHAFTLMTEASELDEFLDSIPDESVEDTIGALEAYEGEFPLEAVVPSAVVLLNRIPKLPHRPNQGVFGISRPDLTVVRVVVRMLRPIEDESERETIVRRILANVHSYSSRFLLIRSIGHIEGSGSRLISEPVAAELEGQLVDEARSVLPTDSGQEWDLLRVYLFATSRDGEASPVNVSGNPEFVRDLLASAKSYRRTQAMGSRHVDIEPELAWDALVKVIGEDQLRESVALLRQTDAETELVGLAEKYLSGWRPPEWPE
ncbi:P-loop NTPase fold protein [Sinomonas sp. ASV486]|uniref:P-loop NTPase fold protein n=1 Tax=Sinomonas sp. ASV486 TaxID=3051170 RepID=UPI0027DB2A4D|nr:P-loop NTPase fold protein [Sinomonas sp. ASV486]MDQ4490789.1 P-loop NTPase fold protein [Sinomonas sp. ASV486]